MELYGSCCKIVVSGFGFGTRADRMAPEPARHTHQNCNKLSQTAMLHLSQTAMLHLTWLEEEHQYLMTTTAMLRAMVTTVAAAAAAATTKKCSRGNGNSINGNSTSTSHSTNNSNSNSNSNNHNHHHNHNNNNKHNHNPSVELCVSGLHTCRAYYRTTHSLAVKPTEDKKVTRLCDEK